MPKRKDFTERARATVEAAPEYRAFPEEGVDRRRLEGTRRMRNARLINLEKIKPDPDQPRTSFPQESLEELKNSIEEHGIIQPISVEYIPEEDYYKIIAGERRFRAAKEAGLEEIPCIVEDEIDTRERYCHQLVENVIREDLNPVDKARGLIELKEKLGEGKTWADVERMIGISETRRKQFVALLNLPESIQREIVAIGRRPAKNLVTEKHARALLMLNKLPEKQLELLDLIKSSTDPISGDESIEMAKEMRGKGSFHVLRIVYYTEEELLEKLEGKLEELRKNRGVT